MEVDKTTFDPQLLVTLQELLTKEHQSWNGMVSTYGDEDGCPFYPYFMKHNAFTVNATTIDVVIDGTTLVVNRSGASIFWRSFEENATYASYEDKVQLNMFETNVEFDFSVLQKSPREEGQLKLMLNYIMSFVSLEPSSDLAVLVIGSQGDVSVGGLSFEPLAQWLSELGYRGEFHLFDPCEAKTQQFVVASFKFFVYKEAYDYSQPRFSDVKFDVVLEDVYVPTMSPRIVPAEFQGNIQQTKHGAVPKGESTYVVYRDKTNTVRACVWAGGRSKTKHSKHGLEKKSYRKILGGGHIRRNANELVVYGSSMTYGPVPETAVMELFNTFDVRYEQVHHGREAYDPDWHILQHHRKARISTQYYGESVPACKYRVQDQYYYTGHEKRLLINHPDLTLLRVRCCKAHAVLDTVNASMKCSTGTNIAKASNILYGRVARRYCSPFAGVHMLAAKNRWLSAARMHKTKREAEKEIIRSLKVTPVLANRALSTLIKHRQISIVRIKQHASIDDFVHPSVYNGRCVLWTQCRKYYFDPTTSTYHSVDGNLLEASMKDKDGKDVECDNPIIKQSYLVRTRDAQFKTGADLLKVVRALDAANVSWRRIYPFSIRGKGEHEVMVDKFSMKIAVVTPMYHKRVNTKYRAIATKGGYVVYMRG